MLTVLKGYVLRLYPTESQKELINKTIGCTRFIYNRFLDEKIKEYKTSGKSKSCYDQIKELPGLCKEYPWLSEVDSCSLRTSLFNLDDAYKRFFKKQNEFPKFKNKDIGNSYKSNNIKNTYKNKNYESIKLDFQNKVITLPKLKEVKFRGYRNKTSLIGNVKSAVIRRQAGKYYVSVLVEEPLLLPEFTPRSIVGLDLGIKDLIVTSYKTLGLMSYLTAGEKEVRAWTIKIGTKAPQAAGKIHSDFEKGFIRAEIVKYDDLVALGSFNMAKEKGKVLSVGKDYVMQDGDVVLFKFNV